MNPARIWIDVETGGFNPFKDALLQIGLITPKGEEHLFNIAPFPQDKVSDEALKISKMDPNTIAQFPPPRQVYLQLLDLFDGMIDKYDPLDKLIFCGYNARFDMDFLRAFFKKNGDGYFGSYFFSPPLDVMSFVAQKISEGRLPPAKSYKLEDVCKMCNVPLIGAHNALIDIKATKAVYEELCK